MIFFIFKPMDIKVQHVKNVPLFEMHDFTMYELTSNGLNTILLGSIGIRYTNKYTIKDIDYTDNSKKNIANMISDFGVYENETVKLRGHVTYVREDGLTFKSEKAFYNKKTADIISDTNYIAYLNDNVITGSYIKYNSISRKIYSKNVRAIYQLKEDNR